VLATAIPTEKAQKFSGGYFKTCNKQNHNSRISPMCLTVSSKTTIGSPLNNGNPPKANGPTIMPATKSPKTIGNFNLANNSANILQQNAIHLTI
jgi:hypothetical protein